jgi:D-inositol-3-phosphate glycosyltransferase
MLNMSLSIAMLSVHTSPLDHPGRTKDAGGMNVYMRELACALAQNNTEVDIFTRWTDETKPQIVQLQPHVRVIHIKAGPLFPISKHDLYMYMPIFARRCEEFRQKEAGYYDIVHSHYWLSGIAGLQLARQWDVPHVVMFHTLARLKQLANPQEPESALRLEMEQRLIQQADCIISPTADERTQIIRYCGAPSSRVVVIPCGVDLDLFVPGDKQQARKVLNLRPERPVLLFAGRLDPFKGPDVLLQTAALMEEDAQVLIVGGKLDGEDKEIQALQELARQLGIADRVRFLGAQSRQEMPLVYSAADVTVMPSYHESFGLVAVESLACQVPVVATRAGGLTMIVRHDETGFLVPRCPGFFAERLDALLRDDQLRAQMSAAARPSVQQFSWGSVGRQVGDIYEELADNATCLVAQ